jgi:hypothetical protein
VGHRAADQGMEARLVEVLLQPLDVMLDGPRAQPQGRSDLFTGLAGDEEVKDLGLSVAELGWLVDGSAQSLRRFGSARRAP